MRSHRARFDVADLVKVPHPKRPVVLKSGGPVMEMEGVEDGRALCSWTDDESKLARVSLPLACLFACTELTAEVAGG